ncbi:tetratricopeptide repeat protein [Streptomyces sp. So13.3]|uniref:tetratricopeptide repeat protein n=1 Tax=Streptomyces TaxID=1883 RepID=UPI00164DB67B|nr:MULTISPECIES: tetratricopeptide repeat protein [Streptomyces]MCZ4102264.1 tetratricopeptide repeat protein [Streptomyces sp. H39-C1]QNA71434.1 tetratricopeptide repeat protein [Streptomyces sp. So13.3]
MSSNRQTPRHSWLSGPDRRVRAATAEALAAAGHLTTVDCHRRLRGPYTAAGSLLRAIVPEVLKTRPALVARHAIEILSVAPELKDLVDAPPQTLTSLASPTERTRYYSPLRTRRIAHGLTEFLNAWAQEAGTTAGRPQLVLFDNLHAADPTDQELITVLLRRARTEVLTIAVGTSASPDLPDGLAQALDRQARRTELPAAPAAPDTRVQNELLQAYIISDGTSDIPAEVAAYRNADPRLRSGLHRVRAVELEEEDDWSLRLGAIPYHRAHAGGRTDDECRDLLTAADYCLRMGYYDAAIELGGQGRDSFDPVAQERLYCVAGGKTAQALGALGRTEEAEVIYRELRGRYTDPVVHMVSSYALSMLYTRIHPAERQDSDLAKQYVNNSIAIAKQLPDPADRAFHTVFHENGLALVELRRGNPETALRLVTEGLARLDRELEPGRQSLHRSVLLHNRAQVNVALGRLDEALEDFNGVLALDPYYPEYYCDRAALQYKRGDLEAALADYDQAATLTPPIHELYYNRADARAAAGDTDGAIGDLRYVLELEPDYLAARVNLVSLLIDEGDTELASVQLAQGLELHPGEPDLLCTRGLIAMEQDDADEALRAFDEALAADPLRSAALANRAVLHYEAGDHAAAVDDLTRALAVTGDDADLLYNRGFAHQAAGSWRAAIADYRHALDLPGADRDAIECQLAECQAALAVAVAG